MQIVTTIAEIRRAVIEADREVKVLERLRERRLSEHRAAQELQQMKDLDEVAARTRREEP